MHVLVRAAEAIAVLGAGTLAAWRLLRSPRPKPRPVELNDAVINLIWPALRKGYVANASETPRGIRIIVTHPFAGKTALDFEGNGDEEFWRRFDQLVEALPQVTL